MKKNLLWLKGRSGVYALIVLPAGNRLFHGLPEAARASDRSSRILIFRGCD